MQQVIPANERIKVAFIAGWGRSGTTLLHDIIGELDGVFPAGELRYIWDRGLAENYLCGTGEPFRDVAEWRSIFDAGFGGMDKVDGQQVADYRDRFHSRHVLLDFIPGGKARATTLLAPYLDYMARLYQAIHDVSGCRMIVDSSKFPSHGYILQLLPNIDVYCIHMIRDPRAVAYSWGSKKPMSRAEGKMDYLEQHSLWKSTRLWLSWNLSLEATWASRPGHYMRIRYEDFSEHPYEVMGQLLKFLPISATPNDLPFTDGERTVRLKPNIAFSGNPDRLARGEVKIRFDDRWKTEMKPLDRQFVTLLTVPLAAHYGYGL